MYVSDSKYSTVKDQPMSAHSQPPEPGRAAAPLARLRQLGPRWRAEAEDAFAGVAQEHGRYMAAGRLVSGWLDRLRGLAPGPGPDGAHDDQGDKAADAAAAAALLDAWDARDSAAPAGAAALPLTPAERAALTACAFAIRYTEVAEWLAARQRRRAMAAARAAGRPEWLVLDEAGEPAGDPFITYRRLEVDPETGTGVLVTTRPDDLFVTVIHEVRTVHVDLVTGELHVESDGSSFEFSSDTERERRVASLRGQEANRDGHPSQ
jgi:hypothetical protein